MTFSTVTVQPEFSQLATGGASASLALLLLAALWALWRFAHPPSSVVLRRRRPGDKPAPGKYLRRPKPAWVRSEVLRLKALMPHDGCRTIAFVFCLLHAHRETVGKTYVAETIRGNGEAILRLRREIKHRKPRPLPRNLIWGLDLTFLPGRRLPVLAILDHGTRALILFEELRTRSAVAIARAIVPAAKRYGLPRYLRTDNEPSLCALTLRTVLFLLRPQDRCIWTSRRPATTPGRRVIA